MDRLISEQYLIEHIKACFENGRPMYRPTLDEVLEMIKAIPTAETKTGHWIEENINEWSRKVFCSECGCTPPFEHVSDGDVYSASGYGVTNKIKFCPNCGARMVGEKE